MQLCLPRLTFVVTTINNDQPWFIEFLTRRNVLTHERKVWKQEAKLSVSYIYLNVSKYFLVSKTHYCILIEIWKEFFVLIG